MTVSFIGGGNRSTQRKPTDLSQVTDKLYHIMLYTSPNRVVINFKEDENIDSYKTPPSSHSSDNFNSGDDYYNETTIYRVHITVPE